MSAPPLWWGKNPRQFFLTLFPYARRFRKRKDNPKRGPTVTGIYIDLKRRRVRRYSSDGGNIDFDLPSTEMRILDLMHEVPVNEWIANPRTLGPPHGCPPRFDLLRQVALEKWGASTITRSDILEWVLAGSPDASGTLNHAATHHPPIAGQGKMDAQNLVDRLIAYKIFVPPNPR